MTAWLESDHDERMVWNEIMANLEEGTEADVEMTLGLFKVASLLLIPLEAAEKRPAAAILQDIASRYGNGGPIPRAAG